MTTHKVASRIPAPMRYASRYLGVHMLTSILASLAVSVLLGIFLLTRFIMLEGAQTQDVARISALEVNAGVVAEGTAERDLVISELRDFAAEQGVDPDTIAPLPDPVEQVRVPGRDGSAGIDGIDGTDGVAGAPGTDGLNGIDGVNGMDGVNGFDGLRGDNGTDGSAGANGADGVQGPQGNQGPQGPQGPEGPAGAAGERGDPGKGIVSAEVVDCELMITYTDGTTTGVGRVCP